LRRIGLRHAPCGTIRLKLLKVGALVRIRRIKVAMALGCPAVAIWMLARQRREPLRCEKALPQRPTTRLNELAPSETDPTQKLNLTASPAPRDNSR
jgi:hypothetical protein